jgi:hypothetical protein
MTDDEIVARVRSEGRETRQHVDQVAASVQAAIRAIAEDQRGILDTLQQELDARTADSLDVRVDLRGITRELLRLKRQSHAEVVALRGEVLAALERLPGGPVEPGPGVAD